MMCAGWIRFRASLMDHLLQPFLQDAIASHSHADRRLCHQVGTPQVQADAPSDQGCKRLVRPVPPSESQAPRPLVAMPWQRPNNGSRMNREVHVRFWESPEVKVLRATRQFLPPTLATAMGELARRPDANAPNRRAAL